MDASRWLASVSSSSLSFTEDFDDLRGDTSLWMRNYTSDKFCLPTHFHETLTRGPIGFTWPHRKSQPWLLHLPRLGHSLREFLITPLLCMWWGHEVLCVISLQREMYVFNLTGLARHFLWLNLMSQLFLSPQPIDKKAEKDISVYRWRKTSCPGSRSAQISHLPWHWQIGYPNAWTNIWCLQLPFSNWLSALLI